MLKPWSIGNTSSIFGLNGDPGWWLYVATKHAVTGMTKAAALDYAKQNIRVNAVGPGPLETPLLHKGTGGDPHSYAAFVPMGRIGQPDEIADAVVWRASRAGKVPLDGREIEDRPCRRNSGDGSRSRGLGGRRCQFAGGPSAMARRRSVETGVVARRTTPGRKVPDSRDGQGGHTGYHTGGSSAPVRVSVAPGVPSLPRRSTCSSYLNSHIGNDGIGGVPVHA